MAAQRRGERRQVVHVRADRNLLMYLMAATRSRPPNKKRQSLSALPSNSVFQEFFAYFAFRRAIPASPAKPAPKRSMVAGSGIGVPGL